MQNNYTYTAADFERYHSGRMSEAEMHALEKTALQDEFLADALEGYAYTNTPQKDIAELKEKFLTKKKKKNVFFLIQNQNVWMRIAALFILIAGISYLAYQLNFNKENSMLAKKEDRQDIKDDTKQIVTKTDSVNMQKETAVSPFATKEPTITKENKKIVHDIKISTDKAIQNSSDDVQRETVQTAPNPEAKRDFLIAPEKNLMKGQVVDSLGNPVKYASIKDKNAKTIVTSDAEGRFKMKANDSSLTADISALGYKAKQEILSDKKEQVIVMQHDNRNLEEVVVTANGAKRENKNVGYSTIKIPGIVVNDSTLQPVTGWKKFNEYVKENIKAPKDSEGENYKGKVVLSFEINKKGDPKKIKVEQPLCKPCDEEAKRLLMQGTKWKYINNERQRVTIEF
ncbi:MAG: carboxypeptidase-like regulatory domain-containing protein [Ginsengibacter sp.]